MAPLLSIHAMLTRRNLELAEPAKIAASPASSHVSTHDNRSVKFHSFCALNSPPLLDDLKANQQNQIRLLNHLVVDAVRKDGDGGPGTPQGVALHA